MPPQNFLLEKTAGSMSTDDKKPRMPLNID